MTELKIKKDEIKKILLIKLRGIGDVILSTIVIDNLRKEFPQADIDFLTEAASRPALEFINEINEVLIFNRKSSFERFKLFFSIRKKKYDLVLDLFSNPATAQITKLSGAKYRAGFPYKGRKYAYNLFGPAERDKFHAAELHLEFLKRIGIKASEKKLLFGLTSEDRKFAEDFIKTNFPANEMICGISPSGGWPSKKCDPEKFAEIADSIVNKFNAKILIIWGPADKAEAEEIKSLMINESVFAPPTSIRQMAALIEECDILIANDSGPMHISTAVGTPTLSLHGPTDPKLQGPYGDKHEYLRLEDLHCIGCNLLECPFNHECFRDLPVERVLEKVKIIDEKNSLSMRLNEKN